MKKISPSILSADFTKLGEEIKAVEAAGADLIHIDVMDGHFVPNITIGPFVVEAVKRAAKTPLDVHLMIENPDNFITQFIKAGSSYITVHIEAAKHLHRTIQVIKESGVKAGVSLNPATSLSAIDEGILKDIDLLLIMSVNPGFSGQKFIPSALQKIKDARRLIDSKGLKIEIEVDGGVKADNAGEVFNAGADIIVSGSGIFETKDYKETIAKMLKAMG
ncbi:MAG: ribulose-phosphate 3-epimerase [Nitrospirae bacterium]|nr:ribulose-phosphate 3-epimerase [Nitrospirota bacterium]